MNPATDTEQIIRSHVLWAMGAGLIPLPLLDIAAVTGVQLDMLKQLAAVYGVDYSKEAGKAFVSALSGGTLAAVGASIFKAIPGVGTVLGGLSMSALSGASTYAVGQVAVRQFAASGTLFDVDLEQAKRAYKEAFKQGEAYVEELTDEAEEARDVFEKLEKLGRLRDRGILTEEEFEAKKRELLDRL